MLGKGVKIIQFIHEMTFDVFYQVNFQKMSSLLIFRKCRRLNIFLLERP